MSAFSLLLTLCLWALVCLGVYSVVRLFERKFPYVMCAFAGMAMLVLLPIFGASVVFAWNNPGQPYPVALVGGAGVVFLFTLGGGATLWRAAIQKSENWWHSLLAFYLYFVLAHVAVISGAIWISAGNLLSLWTGLTWLPSLWFSGDFFYFCALFIFWMFPLGAPLAETILNSFKHALEANATGSFR